MVKMNLPLKLIFLIDSSLYLFQLPQVRLANIVRFANAKKLFNAL
ncbi:hypothetical protein DOY81_007370, partial [Sarcophaga bullata]